MTIQRTVFVALILGLAPTTALLVGEESVRAKPPGAGDPRNNKDAQASGVVDWQNPRSVFEAYVKTCQASDWKAMATYLDPASLASLQGLLVEVSKAAAGKGQDKQVLNAFTSAESIDGLARQSGAEAFSGLLSGLSRMNPDFQQALASSTFDYLGEIKEGDNLVHIVHRTKTKLMGVEITKVAVTTLRKTPAGWRLELDAEIKGLVEMLKKQFAAAPPAT